MMQASVPRLIRPESAQLPAVVGLALVAVLLLAQTYLPLHAGVIGSFDLPLLAAVYLALDQRNPIGGLLIGAGIGLGQDALSHGPLGLFGIIKTVIGYLAASVSLVIEVGYPGARMVLTALGFMIHQVLLWTIHRALLSEPMDLQPTRMLMLAAAHAALALVVYSILDRLRKAR